MTKQIINPLIRFRQKAQGRLANRIGGNVYARAVSSDRCFLITDAAMGVSASNGITVCFNKEADATCNTGFTFKLNGVPFTNVVFSGFSQPCAIWTADNGTSADSAGPSDEITLDYTPGTCSQAGESDCALEELTDFPVSNFIYGPVEARVSDAVGDNIIRVFYDVNPSTTDVNAWAVKVNSAPVTVNSAVISNNEVRLTLAVSVAANDTVVYTQSGTVGTRTTAIDGRTSYWFYDEPVTNAVGTDYWAIVDNSPWMLANQTDTWSVA